MTIRLDEMSWPEIKEVLGKPHVVILPTGTTEEHGAHLPVNVDAFQATYFAEHSAQKVMEEHPDIYVLVAPTISYGEISKHKMFPGTIGVKADTLIKMLIDIVGSFLDQGFKNVIVYNNHDENIPPIQVALTMVADEHPGANIFGITGGPCGLGFDARPGLSKAGAAGKGHALEAETSVALAIEPQLVHLEKAMIGSRELPLSERYIGDSGGERGKGVIYCSGTKGFEKSGTFGDPTMASKEAGEKSVSTVISDLADIIVQVVKGKDATTAR